MKQQLQIQRENELLSLIEGVTYARVTSWYGCSSRDLHLDLIVPKNRAGQNIRPAILWICGGAFCVMDRAVWIPELVSFARRGYVVASLEYRTTNEGAFPLQIIDVKAAIRFLRANAGEFCIDGKRIFVMGESAGGTLACLAGLKGNQTEYDVGQHLNFDSRVQGVIDLYGITDFGAMRRAQPDPAAFGVPSWALESFSGGNTAEQLERVSPIFSVTKDAPPFLILHGDADRVVPLEQSERMYEALLRERIPTRFYTLKGAGHGDDLFFQVDVVRLVAAFLDAVPSDIPDD